MPNLFRNIIIKEIIARNKISKIRCNDRNGKIKFRHELIPKFYGINSKKQQQKIFQIFTRRVLHTKPKKGDNQI